MALLLASALWVSPRASSKGPEQRTFGTPEEAVQAFADAVRNKDFPEILKILGPRGEEVISSGDKVADARLQELFLASYDEKHLVVKRTRTAAELVMGKADWPFPIPIVMRGKKWAFDTDRGAEEILDRRIGRNELDTLDVLEAYSQAQREYFLVDRDQDGVLEYAQRIRSSEGRRDGLYWPAPKGVATSPMGPLFAKAATEGYGSTGLPGAPYRGYRYKVLASQGPEAPGGAFSYVVNGNMVAGYAAVAWPAEYGNSGVMTFLLNSNGIIYEKDLGEKTGEVAQAVNAYNPDSTWQRAK